MTDQLLVFGVLLLTLVLFVWGRWRYDLVALMALLIVAMAGLVPAADVFAGFGHPAVISVAAVLVVSRGLENSGLVDLIASCLTGVGDRPTVQVAALTGLVAICSGFMNNVGALALLMPVAVQMARRSGHSPSLLLMPLAFGSLLGGMTTLIGTPPNIIVANFRSQTGQAPFAMFDFTPVGGCLALMGGVFLTLVGWRLVPRRQGAAADELFEVGDYLSEVRVPAESKIVGKTLHHLETIADCEATVVGVVRDDTRLLAPSSYEILQANDTLIVEAEPEDLKKLVETLELELVGETKEGKPKLGDQLNSEEVRLIEAIVTPGSPVQGKTATDLGLRWRFGINLLAVARQGQRVPKRLSQVRFWPGDILLLQGTEKAIQEALASLGWLPLAERKLKIAHKRQVLLALVLFGSGLLAAAVGWLAVPVAFTAVAVAMILVGLLSLRGAYESIDWPVIVLLAAMIPVGQALETTGGAQFLADQLLRWGRNLHPVATLALVLIGTMCLSDLINNAAAALLMAPIALNLARGLDVSSDPFLLSVAIGASCAFLTPIGHQSNTLVMVPGGYRFGDYWRMGLPLEILIVALGLPLLLWLWPL